MKSLFLTKEELESFNSSRENFFNLKSSIADLTIDKELITRKIAEHLSAYDSVYSELIDQQNSIHAKYGECRVDYTTGEINVNP
jgi:hypothetical protein